MPDHLIVSGDYAHRIKHLAAIGLKPYEIAHMLRIPEARVNLIIRAVDGCEDFTTTNC